MVWFGNETHEATPRETKRRVPTECVVDAVGKRETTMRHTKSSKESVNQPDSTRTNINATTPPIPAANGTSHIRLVSFFAMLYVSHHSACRLLAKLLLMFVSRSPNLSLCRLVHTVAAHGNRVGGAKVRELTNKLVTEEHGRVAGVVTTLIGHVHLDATAGEDTCSHVTPGATPQRRSVFLILNCPQGYPSIQFSWTYPRFLAD